LIINFQTIAIMKQQWTKLSKNCLKLL